MCVCTGMCDLSAVACVCCRYGLTVSCRLELSTMILCLTWRQWIKLLLGVVVVELVIILLSEIKLHVGSEAEPPAGLNGYADSVSADSFLLLYQAYCADHLYPKVSNVPTKFLIDYHNSSVCSCVPDTLGAFLSLSA